MAKMGGSFKNFGVSEFWQQNDSKIYKKIVPFAHFCSRLKKFDLRKKGVGEGGGL